MEHGTWLQPALELATRTCKVCGEVKPLHVFGPDKRAHDGYSRRCKECINAKARQFARNKYERDPAFRAQRADYWKKFREQRGDDWAKAARRRDKLMRYYGITPEIYDEMYAAQSGRCAICGGTQEEADVRKRFLAVDHDHVSGRVRALLCENCNFGLGKFMDDPDRLDRAAAYLRRFTGG